MLHCHPKLVALNEETYHEIAHGCRFGEANGAAREPLNPGPQIDVFALDGLHLLFTDGVLRRMEMALVGAPPIRVKPRNAKRLQQRLQLPKDHILSSPKDVRQHGAMVVIDGMPQSPRLRFLVYVTPHLIEL